MTAPVDSGAAVPDEPTRTPEWLLFVIAAGLPILVFVALIQVTIGVASRITGPWPLPVGPLFLLVFAVLFSLIPGIASLAPRITGSERTGRWAMAVFAIFVGGALTRRLLDEFYLGNPGLYARRVNVLAEIIQTFVPGIVLGLGVYVAARIGWHYARLGDQRGLLAGFATAAVVALIFAGFDFLVFVMSQPLTT
jgi:uncharacterized membrane protein YhaH (DUF805 family)